MRQVACFRCRHTHARDRTKVAAFWQGGLVVDEFDERLFEFLVAWRGDVGRARVWGFIIEVVGERHAIARGGGQNFVLDVAKEGDEADHLLRRCGERIGTVERPILSTLTKHELTTLVWDGQDDDRRPNHILTSGVS